MQFESETRVPEVEEVYLWRGSSEERALRSMWGKVGRFSYYDQQLDYPDWSRKMVLDFGGNEGNLLLDHNCTIRPENYYCIDVLKEALEEGRKRFPRAHWVHYNRYNCSFNPEGIEGLPIPEHVRGVILEERIHHLRHRGGVHAMGARRPGPGRRPGGRGTACGQHGYHEGGQDPKPCPTHQGPTHDDGPAPEGSAARPQPPMPLAQIGGWALGLSLWQYLQARYRLPSSVL